MPTTTTTKTDTQTKMKRALEHTILYGYPLVEPYHKVDNTDIKRFRAVLAGIVELLDEIKG